MDYPKRLDQRSVVKRPHEIILQQLRENFVWPNKYGVNVFVTRPHFMILNDLDAYIKENNCNEFT